MTLERGSFRPTRLSRLGAVACLAELRHSSSHEPQRRLGFRDQMWRFGFAIIAGATIL